MARTKSLPSPQDVSGDRKRGFGRINGVVDAAVGYMGGHVKNPTYQMVCTDETGHAEVVQVTYDPAVISYEQLLDAFWNMHDPTTPDRQGFRFWNASIGRRFFTTMRISIARRKHRRSV